MTAVVYAAAAVLLVSTYVLYFHVHFRAALFTGVFACGAETYVAHAAFGPFAFWICFLLLVLLPLAMVGVHVVDKRVGLFVLPTFYAIPIAMLLSAGFCAGMGIALLVP